MPMFPDRLGKITQFLRGLAAGTLPAPPAQQAGVSYRLNEDGSRRLCEDGSAWLLES